MAYTVVSKRNIYMIMWWLSKRSHRLTFGEYVRLKYWGATGNGECR